MAASPTRAWCAAWPCRHVEQAAGAPHGSVTYWFGSREGLISALIDWLCEESERQARAIATPVRRQIAAGQTLGHRRHRRGALRVEDGAARDHLARMELELQGAREPAHAERMTQAAPVFWDMCAAIAKGLGSDDPDRDGRAMAVMLDGFLLDRLAQPPQSQDVVAASVRWLLAGPPASPN